MSEVIEAFTRQVMSGLAIGGLGEQLARGCHPAVCHPAKFLFSEKRVQRSLTLFAYRLRPPCLLSSQGEEVVVGTGLRALVQSRSSFSRGWLERVGWRKQELGGSRPSRHPGGSHASLLDLNALNTFLETAHCAPSLVSIDIKDTFKRPRRWTWPLS